MIQVMLNIEIADDIKNIIILYVKTYLIYGIGINASYQLGIKKRNIKKWRRLYDMESLLFNPKRIYVSARSLSVITRNDLIYSVGDNPSHKLGINVKKHIQQLTVIPINNVKLRSKAMMYRGDPLQGQPLLSDTY